MQCVINKRGQGIISGWLIGVIDEKSQFDELHTTGLTELRLNCKEVTRLTSAGIKQWRAFFGLMRNNQVKLVFSECPLPLIEQINYIIDFILKDEVESISVKFFCEQCSNRFLDMFTVKNILSSNFNFPTILCQKCKNNMTSEQDTEEYIGFLTKRK